MEQEVSCSVKLIKVVEGFLILLRVESVDSNVRV